MVGRIFFLRTAIESYDDILRYFQTT